MTVFDAIEKYGGLYEAQAVEAFIAQCARHSRRGVA